MKHGYQSKYPQIYAHKHDYNIMWHFQILQNWQIWSLKAMVSLCKKRNKKKIWKIPFGSMACHAIFPLGNILWSIAKDVKIYSTTLPHLCQLLGYHVIISACKKRLSSRPPIPNYLTPCTCCALKYWNLLQKWLSP